MTIYTDTLIQYHDIVNTKTQRRTHIHTNIGTNIQVLNKKAAWTNKVQWNMQPNMQISHRCTRTRTHCKEQNELSKTHKILLWGNQLNLHIKKYQKFRNK